MSLLTKMRTFLLTLFLLNLTVFSSVAQTTYTTIANGNWTSASTWQGGSIPNLSNLPSNATVNIQHTVAYNAGGNIINNGIIRIAPTTGTTARLNVPTGINVENNSTGRFIITDGSFVQFRFTTGNDGQPYSGTTPGASKQAGTFKNVGGYIFCNNALVEIAQDWTNESGGRRTIKNSCVFTGQNFSISSSSSRDTLWATNLSIGWHGSGNFSVADATVNYQGFRCQLAGTSGNFELNSGTLSTGSDIDYVFMRNHVANFNCSGKLVGSSSVSGTANLDAYCTQTYEPNGKFTGTRTATCALTLFPANCSTGGTLPPVSIDMQLSSSLNSNLCYAAGTTRTYSVTATNSSTSNIATAVQVKFVLPATTTYQSTSGSGTYNTGTQIVSFGDMLAGQSKSQSVTVEFNTNGTSVFNSYFVQLQQTDPTISNDSSTASVSPCSTLPVQLLSFLADRKPSGLLLSWQTSYEWNSSHFDVEYSPTAVQFTAVGRIAAAGFTHTLKQYQHSLTGVLAADGYYRLKMVDADGSFEYSPVVKITATENRKAVLYPNPLQAGGTAMLQFFAATNETASLQIFSASGILLGSKLVPVHAGANFIPLRTDVLPTNSNSGFYLIRIVLKNAVIKLPFNIQ